MNQAVQPLEMTLKEAITLYLQALIQNGKHPKTVAAYRSDLNVVMQVFDSEGALSQFTLSRMGKFLNSSALGFKQGGIQSRGAIGQERIVRVLRQFLLWCQDKGYLDKAPLPLRVLHYKGTGTFNNNLASPLP